MRFLLCLSLLFLCGCLHSVKEPLDLRLDEPRTTHDKLVVMLPGFSDGVDEFFDYGLVHRARQMGPYTHHTFLSADVNLRHYTSNVVVERFREDILAEHPDAEMTLVGVSMGGMGVIGLARAFPDEVKELVMIAPFLGNRSLIRRFAADETTPRPGDTNKTRYLVENWHFLLENPNSIPMTVLYGEQDRLSPVLRLLEEKAPHIHFISREGGHKWKIWNQLWEAHLVQAEETQQAKTK